MKLKDAYDKLPEYCDGELSPRERMEFEQLLKTDAGLRDAVSGMQQLDTMLRAQPWINPSPHFTQRVLSRIPAARPATRRAPERAPWLERALLGFAAVIFLGILTPHVRLVGEALMSVLRDIGFWLGTNTGMAVFAVYPILLLVIFPPIVAGAVASCALSGRCRMTRSLTL